MTRGDSSNYHKCNPLFIESFANSLNARNSAKYTRCLQYYQKIESALLNANGISVNRVHLSGSLGKNTALYYIFDVDIVVFIDCNGYHNFIQQRRHFVEEIEDIVLNVFYSASFSKTKKCDTSFQVTIDGIDFDILPALNGIGSVGWDSSRRARLQHDSTTDLIHSITSDKCYLTSFKLRTGMAELSDLFIKEQSEFVHNIVLLAKHWCRTYLDKSASFYGRSSLVELVAVWTARKVEASQSRKNYTVAILEFLDTCAKLSSVAIEFDYPPNKSKFRSNCFRRNIPYIMDPVNPYHNRMHKINPNAIQSLSRIAQSSLDKLRRAFSEPEGSASILLDNFFHFQQHMKADYHSYELFEKPKPIIIDRPTRPPDRPVRQTSATSDIVRPKISGYGKSYPAPAVPYTPPQQIPQQSFTPQIIGNQPQRQIYSYTPETRSSYRNDRPNSFVKFLRCICCCFCCDDD